jgi:hypothetical protein
MEHADYRAFPSWGVFWLGLLREGRYLDAVLGRERRDPLHVCLLPEDDWPAIAFDRPTDLLEEALVEAPWRLGYQHPAHVLPHAPVCMKGSLGK